ncbi:MAG TPA: hypothetical protein VNK06_03825 [Thermodesulfobacteriota bacterium]|nr:hypothetical protein [Thermodesulfobacteriota bacterium]
MSQRVKRDIRRLCQSLLYMTALHLCPAFRKKAQREGCDAVMARYRSLQEEGREVLKEPVTEKTIVQAWSLFSRVLGSLPAQPVQPVGGMEVVVSKFQVRLLEFGNKCRYRTEKPDAPLHDRTVERSRKTGFDLLRVTQNLARGDLEQNPLPL